jgi:hypothetical protein
MKLVTKEKKGNYSVTVQSPWLTIEEACAYLGISKTTFQERGGLELPYGGDSRMRRFHCHEVLDPWFANVLSAEHPFRQQPRNNGGSPQRRRAAVGESAPAGLVDPVNGKVYPAKKA